MGSVWEGVHTTLGTRVACKFIEAEYAGSGEARERFENEARAAATLRSKHVVEVYDHGVTGDGRPYIVMEFLQGEPLDSRLDRRGTLTLAETALILQQVARALTRAHTAGIVHRDLKPENVFLVWDEEDHADVVKVVDFGIAKFTDSSLGISSQTRTGSLLGTPYYMSPEQARGLRSVDARSDLWSLAVISYRCLTGHYPFTGEAIGDLLVRICTSDAARPSSLRSDLPQAVDTWMARALDREPERRFQSAKEMADAFSVMAGTSGAVSQRAPSTSSEMGAVRNAVSDTAVLSKTAGALTNAAFERDARGRDGASSTRSSSTGRLLVAGGVALAVVGVVGALLVRSGGADDAASAAQSAQPEGDMKGPASTIPTAEAAPVAEPAKEAPPPTPEVSAPVADVPSPAVSAKPDPKSASTTSPAGPRPRRSTAPAAPTPAAAPASPAPRPAAPRTPRRSTNDDELGY
jgi:serine/threonine-protein kinase